jgi:endonuclease/exonuclease/phosphatase (EEP) superfamily protein YafD
MRSSETSTLLSTSFFFFHWHYIPGWCLTSSATFRHSCLAHILILQVLHLAHVMSSSNSSHNLNFVLPILSPSHLSLTRLMNFTTLCSSQSQYNSEFLRLLQNTFSNTGPIIFPQNFSLKI